MSAAPRTARGEKTRRRLLEAADRVFAAHGYTESSVSRITERAGVGQGTFYLYFDTKLDVFNELVEDLNHRPSWWPGCSPPPRSAAGCGSSAR